jgi:hypothetical protein
MNYAMIMEKFQELLPNFILITVAGGIFTFCLSLLRDRKVRKDAALSALRDLMKQVDDLYRSMKQIRRTIRSRQKEVTDGRNIDTAFFEARIDELSNTQLKLEQARNAVRIRLDLFNGDRRTRILKEISYSEKYLHDVVEDVEKGRVTSANGVSHISKTSCVMLTDFLSERWMPDAIKNDFAGMDDVESSEERYKAFQRIVSQEKLISGQLKHKSISDECLLLAMREMRDVIVERHLGWRRLIPGIGAWAQKLPKSAFLLEE